MKQLIHCVEATTSITPGLKCMSSQYMVTLQKSFLVLSQNSFFDSFILNERDVHVLITATQKVFWEPTNFALQDISKGSPSSVSLSGTFCLCYGFCTALQGRGTPRNAYIILPSACQENTLLGLAALT